MSAASIPPPSPAAERRTAQAELARNQLLDAAEAVFGRKGFHETTLREIAERAEFAVGTVYSFFESKDDLFRQIFVRRGDEFMPGVRAVVEDAATDPVAQLHALVDFEVGFFRLHPRFGRLYLRYSNATQLSADRDVDRTIRARYDEAMALHATVFERGQAAGTVVDGEPAVLARLLAGLVAAFQASDPAVVGDEAGRAEPLEVDVLHAVVDRAFRA